MKPFLKKIISKISYKNEKVIDSQKMAVESPEIFQQIEISQDEVLISAIYHSGLFSESWYKTMNPDVNGAGSTILEHYYFNGYKEGRSPSYLFDPVWYLENNNDVKIAGVEPLSHYVMYGEKEGRQPSVYFSPTYYRSQVELAENESPLKHFFESNHSSLYSPIADFDVKYYLMHNEDIADIDPYLHFILQGYLENRNPNPNFDTAWYVHEYLDGDPSVNAFNHYLTHGMSANIATKPDLVNQDTTNTVNYFELSDKYTKPGVDFEEFEFSGIAPSPQVKAIAYYLPQFHPFDENNEWWGTGFTEWTNVTRGKTRFRGHHQPHLPRDLGYYDLRLEETLIAQAKMARDAGLEGFCFYHYWFNGKRLMDGPVNTFLDNQDIDLPFCIMWCNENWTRRWDGFDNDILISQDYHDEDDIDFVADIARHFSDKRYIRLDGRALFFIYRPKLIPDAVKKIALWRQLFKDNHGETPLIYMVQAFEETDPRPYDLDGAIEFPPHKVASGLPSVAADRGLLDPNFEGHYPSYDAMVDKSCSDSEFDYDLIKCVTPSWDNEARKPGRGMGFVDATPKKYQDWLSNCVTHAKKHPIAGQHKFVAINAWNEWAEGSHLEPDIYWGSAYLNATYKALHNVSDIDGKYSLLLVGHDAYKHGAQLLTLNIFRTLKQQFGIDVKVVLLDGGPLVDDYKKIGDTYVCNGDVAQFSTVVTHLKKECGLSRAICNTTVTGKIARVLDEQNISFISLIHELKNLIKEYELQDAADDIAHYADKIVFAASTVKNSFEDVVGEVEQDKLIVHPQGIYQTLDYSAGAHGQLRKSLGLALNVKIIINVGYADLRKGFDLFVNLAKLLVQKNSDYHFIWIGDIEPRLKRWLASDLESKLLANNFHNVLFTDEISTYLNGADVFAMTSREDPFPSVVLESLALGTPVMGFEGGGGFTDLLQNPLNGQTVAMADIMAMANAIEGLIVGDSMEYQRERSKLAVDTFKWDEYVFSLLEYVDSGVKRVTVSVPNYNYADHIEERLQSIFEQGYPIFELNILDDQSTDNSVEVIKNYCLSRKRNVNLVINKSNSGSVFKQWKKSADVARGEFLWIAEADDAADPTFLEKMLQGDTNFTLAYTDSVQVDENNKHLADNYRYYYDKGLVDKLDKPGVYSGIEVITECLAVKNQFMNVSSVLFSTKEIKQNLELYLTDILSFKVAGDWFLYVKMLSNQNAKCKIVGNNLNIHRRHSGSVTHQNLDIQLVEIFNLQKVCNEVMNNDSLMPVQQEYLENVGEYIKMQNEKGIKK